MKARIFTLCVTSIILGLFWFILGRPLTPKEPDVSLRLQCVSYTPFRNQESPDQLKKGEQIPIERLDADLKLLASQFSCIRIYATAGLLNLPPVAEKYGLQILLGAWVSPNATETTSEIERAIQMASAYPELIKAVVVGNEALLRREVTGPQLALLIRQVKQALPNIPVTYADVWEFWLTHPEVAPETDWITIHILPYWEDIPTPADQALNHIEDIYIKMQKKFPDKPIFIGETGWPSAGRMREGALPSPINQANLIRSFVSFAEKKGWNYNLIEAFDQPWKRMSEGIVGGYWGIIDTQRNDKHVLAGTISLFPEWKTYFALSLSFLLFGSCLVSSYSSLILLFFLSIFLPLQIHQDILGNRTLWDWIESGISWFFLVSLHASILKPNSRYLSKFWLPAALFIFTWLSFGLFFDGRYRVFPIYGMLIPAWAVWRYGLSGSQKAGSVAVLLGMILVAIGIQETFWNWQSNFWILTGLVFVFGSLRHFNFNSLITYKPWMVLGLGLLLGAVIRLGLLEPRSLSEMCLASPQLLVCKSRDAIGMLLYFKVFGALGFAFALLATLHQRATWTYLGIFFASLGLSLYNVNLAGIALIMTWITSSSHTRSKN